MVPGQTQSYDCGELLPCRQVFLGSASVHWSSKYMDTHSHTQRVWLECCWGSITDSNQMIGRSLKFKIVPYRHNLRHTRRYLSDVFNQLFPLDFSFYLNVLHLQYTTLRTQIIISGFKLYVKTRKTFIYREYQGLKLLSRSFFLFKYSLIPNLSYTINCCVGHLYVLMCVFAIIHRNVTRWPCPLYQIIFWHPQI